MRARPGSTTHKLHFPLEGDPPATRYGAPAQDLIQAAGVLRARTAKMSKGEVSTAEECDLAAAVIAADAWMWLLKADSLNRASQHGPAAVAALAAALSRAAGHKSPQKAEKHDGVAASHPNGEEQDVQHMLADAEALLDPEALAAAESYYIWASSMCNAPHEAIMRAAADLSAGSGQELTREERRLAQFAELLNIAAYDLLAPQDDRQHERPL